MTNLNDLAKVITLSEGKAKSLSIAQIKEVLKITLKELSKMTWVEVINLMKRYQA